MDIKSTFKVRYALQAFYAFIFGIALANVAAAQEGQLLDVRVGDDHHTFTLKELQALPVSTIETTTIWTEGKQKFQGVSLKDLLESIGVSEGMLDATAINDYSVEVPISDAVQGGPIIAYLNNDEEMSRRGKGPLWIVYPYDSDVKYQTETIYSRSIWQLDRLVVK